ncbi:LytTR family DNA-binding domain-containing protein [Chryseobacterium sp. SSA4.19]|uniref:LytR/AlgR family response regulator transcription factor n=1 Tax=Chryseobacterium sp. SSA4.19 TaxID=2919915 RepID=UPI001F4E2980|nr:LytTR family DNA-binding domain-containing protein [Chryseobacterium sp. SSA4.19]MCJ8154410.1 LytTR family DNA-binding domain-containing protein [Chryseobacterium sp. SSA4.19]
MYKAVIIEDEYHLREALSILLEMTVPDKIQIIGYAEGLQDAVALIDRLKPDVVFMDIMLKNGTGFEVLNRIQYKSFHLIFTTAYEQYAIRAFKFNAMDYLLKPIDSDELKNTIERIEKRKQEYSQFDPLLTFHSEFKKTPERIVLPTQEAMHVIRLKSIIRCETSGSYTTFFLEGEKQIIVSKPLKYYEEILVPPEFIRIHQSHLININFVSSYSKDGIITMHDKSTVPISRANRELFFRLMKNESDG